MSLLDRARQRRDERDGYAREQVEAEDRHARNELVRALNHRLKLEGEDAITAAMLAPILGDRRVGHRELYAFTYEGLHFLAGYYWHGNPGDDLLLAVEVSRVRGMPEWPPPHPRSVWNTGWAPAGYRAVQCLADLADAIDDGGRRR